MVDELTALPIPEAAILVDGKHCPADASGTATVSIGAPTGTNTTVTAASLDGNIRSIEILHGRRPRSCYAYPTCTAYAAKQHFPSAFLSGLSDDRHTALLESARVVAVRTIFPHWTGHIEEAGRFKPPRVGSP